MVFSEISKQVLFWAELSGKIFCSPVATSLRGLKSVLFFRPPSLLLDSRGRIPPPAVSPFNSALNAFLWSGSVRRRVVLQTLSCKNLAYNCYWSPTLPLPVRLYGFISSCPRVDFPAHHRALEAPGRGRSASGRGRPPRRPG